tara:strand:- start:1426 stop:1653 length:228 start_codon:yes stop_codon:yes gene_type:complete
LQILIRVLSAIGDQTLNILCVEGIEGFGFIIFDGTFDIFEQTLIVGDIAEILVLPIEALDATNSLKKTVLTIILE